MSANQVIIRKAETSDISALTVLIIQVWLDTYVRDGIKKSVADYVLSELTTARTARYLAQADIHILLAEVNGNLVGYSQTILGKRNVQVQARHQDGHQAELDHLYVHPAFFGRGIGSQLLAQSEAYLLAQGVQHIWLTAWIGNQRALRFYPHVGYADIGATFFHLEGEDVPNRIFCKSLSSPA